MVLEAGRYGREHWTEEQRRLYAYQPDDTRQALRQNQLLMREEDYLTDCASEVTRLLRDPLVEPHTLEEMLGDSQLRPTSLYPI